MQTAEHTGKLSDENWAEGTLCSLLISYEPTSPHPGRGKHKELTPSFFLIALKVKLKEQQTKTNYFIM